jgi:hypothetical protein
MNWFKKRKIDAQISRINKAYESQGLSDRVSPDYNTNTIRHNSTLEKVEIRGFTMHGGMGWDWDIWYEDWVFIGEKKSIKL